MGKFMDKVREGIVARQQGLQQPEQQGKVLDAMKKVGPKSKHPYIKPPEWWPKVPQVSGENLPGLANMMKPLLSMQIEARDQQILRKLKDRGMLGKEATGQSPSDNF